MHFERLVVLADDQTVADGAEVGAQRLDGGVLPLADDEHGVKGEGDLLLAHGGEVRLALGLFLGHLGNGLTPQGAQHAVKDHQISLSAGIYHAGLFQHGIHLDGLLQRFKTLVNGLLQDILHTVALLGGLHGAVSRQTGDREHGALGGLHHGAVGSGHALLHGGGQQHAVGFVHAFEVLGDAAEQQGEDDAGVAPSAPQQGGGGDRGGVGHGGGLVLFQLRRGGLDGEAHVGAGVAVRHGEDVQVIDGFSFQSDAGSAEKNHLLKHAAADSVCHSFSFCRPYMVMESTHTFTLRTSTPVFLFTTYLTSPIMERQTVAMFTPFSTMMCSSMETVLSSL